MGDKLKRRSEWLEKVSVSVGKSALQIIRGDITKQDTEAIVNAANKKLSPGGGVAGAIHKAAGPQLWEECQKIGGCETGEAKITSGYLLPSKYVVHTVGPVFNNSSQNAIDLKNCYNNSLNLARDYEIQTIAFPAISTGIFGYPIDKAAEISLRTVILFLENNNIPHTVRFVLYGESEFNVFVQTLENIFRNQ
jgi:O-acetyl-ADP-ribose deacetylase